MHIDLTFLNNAQSIDRYNISRLQRDAHIITHRIFTKISSTRLDCVPKFLSCQCLNETWLNNREFRFIKKLKREKFQTALRARKVALACEGLSLVNAKCFSVTLLCIMSFMDLSSHSASLPSICRLYVAMVDGLSPDL